MASKKLYNWYVYFSAVVVLLWLNWWNRYCAMVAALCMVLYGYDASVFNSVQGSPNWLEWVDLDPDKNTYMLGLSMSWNSIDTGAAWLTTILPSQHELHHWRHCRRLLCRRPPC